MPTKKIRFFPSSRLGKWAAGLTAFFLVASPLLYLFAERLRLLPDWVVDTFGPSAILAVLVGFALAIAALFKKKDRSITVFMSILVGLAVVVFFVLSIAGDLLF